jgi:hypothetical protein
VRSSLPGKPIDVVVGHHTNPFTSGVARFNELLAKHLDVPVLRVTDPTWKNYERPLLSFKPAELNPREATIFDEDLARIAGTKPLQLFLHDFRHLPVEERLCRVAERIFCGNDETAIIARRFNQAIHTLWAPGLILDTREFEPTELSVFSFGMAHKVQTHMFRRLREMLEQSGRSYSLYVSNANHETASLGDAQLVFEQMTKIFPRALYFLGNLSDVAVFNYLLTTTFFAAFFPGGARANNTSIGAAMEHGAVVITNLDEYSPSYFHHMDNVIDICRSDQLPSDPLVLKKLSVRAIETARIHSWDELVSEMRNPVLCDLRRVGEPIRSDTAVAQTMEGE